MKNLTWALLMGSLQAQEVYRAPQAGTPVCRVLSLSGGGSKGAYEVGVLQQMAMNFSESEMYYDVVSGVSVGAINASGIARFGKGESM